MMSTGRWPHRIMFIYCTLNNCQNAGKGRRILSKMTAQRAFFRRGEKERTPSLTAPVREKILSFFVMRGQTG